MKLVISGVPPWDGEYEFGSFYDNTMREYQRIKEISGVRGGELLEALSAGDMAAWVGFAVVILARYEKVASPDDFWDAPAEAIDFKPDEKQAGVADPPTQPSSGNEPSSRSDSSGASSESTSV